MTLVFDSPLMPGSARVETGGRALRIAQGDGLVTIYPRPDFLPGERLKLTARFADDAAPAQASFWLVGHLVRGARRVEVFRHPRSADALQQEVVEARAEARQCQEEKARFFAEHRAPGALMDTAWLERAFAVGRKALRVTHPPENELTVQKAMSYSHRGSVAVRLNITNQGTEPWTATGALLTDGTGTDTALALGPEPTVAPGTQGTLVVGADRTQESLSCPCTLKLWDARGSRTVTVENILFSAAR